jgi:spore coat protein A, manganese oxidase
MKHERHGSVFLARSTRLRPIIGRGARFALAVAGAGLLGFAGCGGDTETSSSERASVAQAVDLAPRLDPRTIPQFAHELERFRTFRPTFVRQNGRIVRAEYNITITKFMAQQLPPPLPATQLFGYGGDTFNQINFIGPLIGVGDQAGTFRISSPGPKFEQTKGVPARITYRNELLGDHPLAVDPTLDWANPNNFPKPMPPFAAFPPGYPQAQSPITHTTHTHGIEVLPEFDGTPDTWFTNNGILGPEYVSNTYVQPSSNQSAPFWYHDHSFGVTRLDVGMGLAGFSILRDPNNPLDSASSPLPKGEFEVPLIIQDRSFRTDGSILYPPGGIPGVGQNPDINPYWQLTVHGDTNVVNGKVWPNMTVKRAMYRFRILNAANQRFYNLFFDNGMSFRIIGSDGGYLERAQTIRSVRLGVTERADILVDFSQFAPGTQIILRNDSLRFPPIEIPSDPDTDGTVMRFTVDGPDVTPPSPLPATLNTIARLTPNRPMRILIQNTQTDDQGRILQAELDGQRFHSLTTELPTIGATEDWAFVNTTPLDHNKHVHLIEFQVVSRQTFNAGQYLEAWKARNGNPPFTHPTLKLDFTPFLTGRAQPPDPHEVGWKDTVRTPAGMVTIIRVRWNPQELPTGAGAPGTNLFSFNPVYGIGYVWHCHLLEHEDNEMMRPMTVIPIWQSGQTYQRANRLNPGVARGLVDHQGINYAARVDIPNSTQPPPQRFDLWERINNQNGDWALQTIYNVGDRVFFPDESHVYRALEQHQAIPGTEPNVSPTLWELVL